MSVSVSVSVREGERERKKERKTEREIHDTITVSLAVHAFTNNTILACTKNIMTHPPKTADSTKDKMCCQGCLVECE